MKKKERIAINSLKELQLQMPRILQSAKGDSRLALAAAANPLLALERLGYDLSDKASAEIEPYARYGPKGLARLKELQSAIENQLGAKAYSLDKDALKKIMEKDSNPQGKAKSQTLSPLLDEALDVIFAPRRTQRKSDKGLEARLAKAHPALTLLFEYQHLQRQHPAFASKQQFEQLLEGKTWSPFTQIEFQLKSREDRRQRNV
ncbi:MAG: hypothetical protein JNK77_00445 [Saprospiraceae bacterium]|nr:hypothetical protein [Saprospiraceae bacterium]